ncbi:MAG: hypothetical protein HY547_00715 [Elusimicrobia bacterium]|nr:hypothetical protein [Elusimicrobiota bacterium]
MRSSKSQVPSPKFGVLNEKQKKAVRIFLFCFFTWNLELGTWNLLWADHPLLREDLAEGRISDLTKTKKLVGTKGFLMFKAPKYGFFLEGYIRGIVTDYDDRPIEGVAVLAAVTSMEKGEKKKEEDVIDIALEEEGKEKVYELVPNFDAGITDADGVYRIHFSIPIIKNRIDLRGKILYNHGWEQQYNVLGQSYEPQEKESQFRLFFEEKTRLLIFAEGTRKTVVRPVRNTGGPVSPIKLKGSEKPETAEPAKDKGGKKGETPAAKPEKKEQDDFFKGFNFGQ